MPPIKKGKQFLGCFICCLMTYITWFCKAITFSGQRDLLIKPHTAKPWYIFISYRKKKCSLEKLGKEVEECNIFPVQPGILTGSSIKPESSSSFTLSQLRCYPSQCSRDMEHNTLGSSQVKGDFSDCCFSFYYVPPTSTSSKRKTTKIFINPSLLSTHNIA